LPELSRVLADIAGTSQGTTAKDGPSSSIDDLSLALEGADAVFAQASGPQEKRAVTYLALLAISYFLKSVGLQSKALTKLGLALQDIERGHSPALFKPSIQNRPRDRAEQLLLKAIAAAAMQLHMDAGKKKAEASALVARSLHRPDVKPATIARSIRGCPRSAAGVTGYAVDASRQNVSPRIWISPPLN
jgi:hypothetical protein